jgi:RHS repeat-associated protein
MSFKAILHVSGQNIVLDYVDLDLNQSVDARSRPASMTRGGTITVEFDTPSDGDMIADWAANPVKQLDGSITYMNQNQDSVMKTVNFYNAYCIEFMERFDGSMSSSNMKTTIKISPERVNIGGVEHDNNWFVHGTSRGAGAKAVTSSSGIASKEGTEFEKGTVVESKKKEPGLFSDIAHGILDVVGLIPVVGEIADGANALFYLAEGNTTDAALSAAAMIPVAGWAATGAKVGRKVVKAVGKSKVLTKLKPLVKKLPSPKKTPCATPKCTVKGHPVDVLGGYMFTEALDFTISGQIPIVWNRKWLSYSTFDGALGYGWQHSYDMAMFVIEDIVFFRGSDGRVIELPAITEGETGFNREEKLYLIHDKEGYGIRTANNLFHRFGVAASDGEMKLSSIEDFNEFKLEFSYNTAGHLEQIVDSTGRKIQIQNDNAGRILKIVGPHPEKVGKTTTLVSYQYDEFGDLVAVTDALDQKATFEYQSHLMVKETFKDGLSFYFEYAGGIGEDAVCLRTWGDKGIYDTKFQYFPEEKRTIVTNSLGHQTTHYGNESGIVLKTIDSRGGITTNVFNDYNEILETTDPLGNKTSYQYDEDGNTTSVKSADGSAIAVGFNDEFLPIWATDAVGGKWAWEYDNRLNLVSRQDPMERNVQYEYQNGLVSKIINPDGTESNLAYDEAKNLRHFVTADGNISTWLYDNLGNCTKITDPLGNEEWREYDIMSRVTKVKLPDGNLRTFEYDAADNVIRAKDQHHDLKFEYEGMSRMTRRKEDKTELRFFYNTEGQITGLLNEKGEKYSFELDSEGDVLTETGFDGLTRKYQRNIAGQVAAMTRPSGQTTQYQYDSSGRVRNVVYADGTEESFQYRADGALMQAVNQFGKVELSRNVLGQILSDTQNGNAVNSEYDFLGNRNRVTSSMGANLNLQRDKMGDITQMSQEDWTVDFVRNKAGLETERNMGNLKSSFQRDKMGRITEHRVSVGGDAKRTKSYKWGYNDRLHEILDNKLGLTTFEHDIFGNLASANYGSGIKQLRNPDEVGNLFKTEGRTDRKYDKGGRLLEADGINYAYDLEGNLSKKTLKDGSIWAYEWNASGMLSKVVRPDSETVSFEYDALGRRTKKTFKGVSTAWVWDGNTPLHEWTDEQNLTTWLFEENSFAPIGKLKAEATYNIVSDYLGTPFEMYDQSGGRVWQGELDSFGAIQNFKGDSKTDCPFRYQGQYEDAETGLYYNRFRYYSPEEGVYLSQDPIGLSGGRKLYGYVSDTTTRVDIFGLEDPFDYMREALRQQGKAPTDPVPASFKQKWTDVNGDKFEVRAHPADPAHGKVGSILRVGKKEAGLDARGQGKGTQYLDSAGNWHHESTLKPGSANYNAQAAADTHIQIPAGQTCG